MSKIKKHIMKFENFDNMEEIINFLHDFQNGRFKKMIIKKYISDSRPNKKFVGNRSHDIDLIKNDHRYLQTYNFIKNLYDKGHGIKSIIKDNKLPITYPVLRKFIIDIMNIKLRKSGEITDVLRKKRSDKVKLEHEGGIGWFSDSVERKQERGIQGYYFNKSRNKYVWLRSTYEYIYACWLDIKNKIWDIEFKSFRLDDGSLYKPDFFIFYNDEKLKEIIEINGYWKNRSYKFDILKKKLENEGIKCEMISDDGILSYTNDKLKNITKLWKETRLKELK